MLRASVGRQRHFLRYDPTAKSAAMTHWNRLVHCNFITHGTKNPYTCASITTTLALRCTRLLRQRVGCYPVPPAVSGTLEQPVLEEDVERDAAEPEEEAKGTTIDWATTPPPVDLPKRAVPAASTPAFTRSNTAAEGGTDSASTLRPLLTEKERATFVAALCREKEKELERVKIRLVGHEAVRKGEEKLRLTGQTEVEQAERQYQAQLEVRWIEEWAYAQSPNEEKEEHADPDIERQRRLLVKRALLERVEYSKPLAYILGSHPFYGCVLHCRSPVVCPSEETEMWTHWLIEEHLKPAYQKTQRNQSEPVGSSGKCDLTSDGTGETSFTTEAVPSSVAPPQWRVLDVGCGSGCIGLAIAKHIPRTTVVGVDIDPEAVALAKENAVCNGMTLWDTAAAASAEREHGTPPVGRFQALQSDMLEVFRDTQSSSCGGEDRCKTNPFLPQWKFYFDLLVCNPPYYLPEEYLSLPDRCRYWEPRLALLGDPARQGEKQYLYFQELCEEGWRLLKPRAERSPELREHPNFVLEVGKQAELIATMMEICTEKHEEGKGVRRLWDDVAVHLDYNQQPRWISANSTH